MRRRLGCSKAVGIRLSCEPGGVEHSGSYHDVALTRSYRAVSLPAKFHSCAPVRDLPSYGARPWLSGCCLPALQRGGPISQLPNSSSPAQLWQLASRAATASRRVLPATCLPTPCTRARRCAASALVCGPPRLFSPLRPVAVRARPLSAQRVSGHQEVAVIWVDMAPGRALRRSALVKRKEIAKRKVRP